MRVYIWYALTSNILIKFQCRPLIPLCITIHLAVLEMKQSGLTLFPPSHNQFTYFFYKECMKTNVWQPTHLQNISKNILHHQDDWWQRAGQVHQMATAPQTNVIKYTTRYSSCTVLSFDRQQNPTILLQLPIPKPIHVQWKSTLVHLSVFPSWFINNTALKQALKSYTHHLTPDKEHRTAMFSKEKATLMTFLQQQNKM
jgi:hypothetical protein